jgi:hypothetical protein
MAGTIWSEDEVGQKWDRCFTDAIIKFGNYCFCDIRDDRCIVCYDLLTDFFSQVVV